MQRAFQNMPVEMLRSKLVVSQELPREVLSGDTNTSVVGIAEATELLELMATRFTFQQKEKCS